MSKSTQHELKEFASRVRAEAVEGYDQSDGVREVFIGVMLK
jgi:hypothetical protein